LSWIARAFSFDCDPGKIDGVARKPPVENFQRAYNAGVDHARIAHAASTAAV
jgi:hypothetical protein